jgi:hypothetical protein
MPAPEPATAAAVLRRAGRISVIYWICAGLLYVVLGVAFPPAFLLGFQEAFLYVLVVTAIQPWVVRRLL